MAVVGHFRACGASNLKSMSPKMPPAPPCLAGVDQRRDSDRLRILDFGLRIERRNNLGIANLGIQELKA